MFGATPILAQVRRLLGNYVKYYFHFFPLVQIVLAMKNNYVESHAEYPAIYLFR